MMGLRKRLPIIALLTLLASFICRDVSAKTLRESSVMKSSFSQDTIEEKEDFSTTSLQQAPQIRRKLNWFTSILFEAYHHCPPGPLGHKCRNKSGGSGGGSGGGSSSGSGGGSSSSSSSGSGGGSSSSSSGGSSSSSSGGSSSSSSGGSSSSSSGGSSSSSSGSSSGSWSSSTSSGVNSSNGSGSGSGNDSGGSSSATGAIGFSGQAGKMMYLVLASAAAAVAIATVFMAMRRSVPKKARGHPLSGAIQRRMKLFSNFANRSCCVTDSMERTAELSPTNGRDYQFTSA